MRELASLLPALAFSAALHAGAATFAEALLGTAGPGPLRPVRAERTPHFHATLVGTRPQTASTPPTALAYTLDPGRPAGRGTIALPPARYFPPHELDRKPHAVGEIPLVYPAHMPLVARSRIVLSLLIDEGGEVDEVIAEANEAPPELVQLASRAFADARFLPGVRDGMAVKSRLRVEVTFEGE